MALERELKYLDSHKDELLQKYGGKVLVISGEQVSGALKVDPKIKTIFGRQ